MPAEFSSLVSELPTPQKDRVRRVMGIFLPRILSEVLEGEKLTVDPEGAKKTPPRGIILVEEASDEVRSNDVLSDVCLRAHRAGVRAGQTVTEARALASGLRVEYVENQSVTEKLIAIAEVVSRYGTVVSWKFPDTIWIDVTGVAHLFGGEDSLASEVQEQVRLLGHVNRVCVADGPLIARAVARYGSLNRHVVSADQSAKAMGDLPLLALPLSVEKVAWLSRLGLFTVEQLAALPKKTASARLGDDALRILDLAAGIDLEPLVPGQFPRSLREEIEWDEPAYGCEPLLFALRGLVAKLSARLRGRGEACSSLVLTLFHDQAIARHRGVLSQTLLEFDLSSPLSKDLDLERTLRSRVERLSLKAPTVGIRLVAEQLSVDLFDQMNLAESGSGSLEGQIPALWNANENRRREFAVLLAELEAEVGRQNLGILRFSPQLRPEACSLLEPLTRPKKRRKKSEGNLPTKERVSFSGPSPKKNETQLFPRPLLQRWTRIFIQPQPIQAHLALGECFGLGSELYTIESLRFIERLDGVEWWTARATSRDYFWAWLKSPHGGTEALLFVDRQNNERFVQAFGD